MIFEFNNKKDDGSTDDLKCLGVVVKEPESMLDHDHSEDDLECSSEEDKDMFEAVRSKTKKWQSHHHHDHSHHLNHGHDSQALEIGFLYALPTALKVKFHITHEEMQMDWTCTLINYKDIKENPQQKQFIHQKVTENFQESKKLYKIPQNWFDDHWEGQITAAVSQGFKYFAFLNSRKKVYIAYDSADQDQEMVR